MLHAAFYKVFVKKYHIRLRITNKGKQKKTQTKSHFEAVMY